MTIGCIFSPLRVFDRLNNNSRYYTVRVKLKLKLGLFILLSIVFFYGGYCKDKAAKASSNWQPTNGVVSKSRVVAVESSTRNGGVQIDYRPLISYEYEGPHGKMLNDKFAYGGADQKNYRFQAEKIIQQYQPGQLVIVYFDPQNPSQACLEPGRTRDGIALMVIGALIFLGVFVFLGFYALDRYAGMGEFEHTAPNVTTGEQLTDSAKKVEQQLSPNLLDEYLKNARESPLITKHVKTHLFFGPIYRGDRSGKVLLGLLRPFIGKKSLELEEKEQILYLFFFMKIITGGLAVLLVFLSPFLFLMKAPDAPADLLLGLLWLPGFEFIPRLTPHQKYISICRLVLTIPAVCMGINSGNWSW